MTIFRSEEGLVGIMTLGIAPWIAWTVQRGRRSGALPIGRTYVRRDERPGTYRALLLFYLFAGLVTLAIACDLLLGIHVRFWL